MVVCALGSKTEESELRAEGLGPLRACEVSLCWGGRGLQLWHGGQTSGIGGGWESNQRGSALEEGLGIWERGKGDEATEALSLRSACATAWKAM